ncbi:hypothetical protein SAMN05444365_104315 [Micromonospora pattaloongensis]|uniref:Uncharacterized protein n=1 Tax=Micromonospora pattaloongensis TaxID=405436 RepID=A0A1H3P451_9ACTN|nr:hypothetical protein [Micromonospora pattaloongensis]SDY95848.1 hypothetical protein SAMN05444365_104315 [Micromonospora pattaloongensis]
MAAAHTAAAALSTEDLATIRETLAAGRKPKVMFTEAAGQIAGQIGQVVGLTDPAVSEEWVVVRFGRDELPFSPGDLCIPPKGATARRPEPTVEPERPPAPEFKLDRPVVPAPREETTMAQAPVDGDAKPARPKAAKAARPKGPAGLTVTLAYAEGEWTVGATQGSKALAKPYVIRPVEALKMVALIDVPGVQEAVEQILAAERAEAEQQAQRLRAELAEIEARLAELRDAG